MGEVEKQPLMSGEDHKLQWIFVLVLIASLGAAAFIGSTQRSSADCVARVIGTNVASVSARVTHGPTHTFYYPSRLRWAWGLVCKRLGLPFKTRSEIIGAAPRPASDVLWVAITYREKLPVLHLLVAEDVDDEGRVRSHPNFGGLLDESRLASVNKWRLAEGVEDYRGKTIYIRTMSHGKELASIEFR
jgi:hypothetical protein